MTEDEARKCWCPFSRVSTDTTDQNASNRGIKPGEDGEPLMFTASRCITSACMAWRWKTEPREWTENQVCMSEPGDGYCGLAGRP